ncbi:MAG: ATP-binding cassette domain-containing protein [Nocardioidaceae bacterium]|nr:MAG: ATP-binding cassette domain-containing protein [Nocardioidaceae bacterium]
MTTATIRLSGLGVRLGGNDILREVNLEYGPGVHGMLGPNGAGKSTLIRVLASTLRHDAGEVEVLGKSYGRAADVRWVRERLGYLPQTFGYYRGFTAREYVEYLGWLKKVPTKDLRLAADRALDRVDLLDKADTKLKRLSGGMQRRVGLAQAIVNDPRLVLLDEPTVGLDPEQRVRFRELLREIGVDACVVVSTHLVEDVAHACDDVTILTDGIVVSRTTPAELTARGQDSNAPGDSAVERGYTTTLRSRQTETLR